MGDDEYMHLERLRMMRSVPRRRRRMRRDPKSTRPPVDKATTQMTPKRLEILRRKDLDARIWLKHRAEDVEGPSSNAGRVLFGRRKNDDEEDWMSVLEAPLYDL